MRIITLAYLCVLAGCGRSTLDDVSVHRAPTSSASAAGVGGGVVDAGGSVASASGTGGAVVDAAHDCGAMIDDMEDGSGFICQGNGRVGAWYAYNDGFGTQWPAPTMPGVPIPTSSIPGGRGSSTRAIHSTYSYDPSTVKSPGGTWGAGVAVDLDFDGHTYGLYDAGAYDGITFWTRGNSYYVEVRISTAETTLVQYGGTCTAEFCNPHFKSFYINDAWTQERVAFADLFLHYAFPYVPGPFRKDQITNIQFLFIQFNDPSADFWVDDLAFYTDE